MIQLSNAIFINDKFTSAFNKLTSCDRLSGAYLYALVKLTKELEMKRVLFEEAKNQLVKNYGETKEDGSIVVKSEHIDHVNKEFMSLLQLPIEINIEPLTYVEDMELSAQDILLLDPILEFKE